MTPKTPEEMARLDPQAFCRSVLLLLGLDETASGIAVALAVSNLSAENERQRKERDKAQPRGPALCLQSHPEWVARNGTCAQCREIGIKVERDTALQHARDLAEALRGAANTVQLAEQDFGKRCREDRPHDHDLLRRERAGLREIEAALSRFDAWNPK